MKCSITLSQDLNNLFSARESAVEEVEDEGRQKEFMDILWGAE
jgi:hypothetical protein